MTNPGDDLRFVDAHLPPSPLPGDPLVRTTVAGAVERARLRRAQRGQWTWALGGLCTGLAAMALLGPARVITVPAGEPVVAAVWQDAEDEDDLDGVLDAPSLAPGVDAALDALSMDELDELEDELGDLP